MGVTGKIACPLATPHESALTASRHSMTVEIRGANGAPIAETTADAVPLEGADVKYFGEPCTVEEVTWEFDGSWSAIVTLDKPAGELEVQSWKPRLRG